MGSRLLRWLLPVPLLLAWCLPAVHAQTSSTSTEPAPSLPQGPFCYGLAGLFTIVVLLLICVPSRKGTS
jgi:hypothetical protein